MDLFYILLNVLWLLQGDIVEEDGEPTVEVFDIAQERVIFQGEASQWMQGETEEVLQNIDGIYPKVQPIPKDGLLVKMTLEPTIHIENEWLVEWVEEVIFFYSPEEEPYILLFDQENHSYFFTIADHDFYMLLNILNSRNTKQSADR